MKKVILVSLILQTTVLFAQIISPTAFNFNGPVYTTAVKEDTLYVGGAFSHVYTKSTTSSYGGVVDKISGDMNRLLPKPNDAVNEVIDDGNGGWYIGGSFTKVGDSTRLGVAQIDSGGKVTAWNPKIEDGAVYALLKYGSTVFVGGSFRVIAGKSMNGLAAIDSATAARIDWTILPEDWSSIYAMGIADSVLYFGGSFSKINGQNRGNLAAINLVDKTLTAWSPDVSGSVTCLGIHNDKMYVGGGFSIISGLIRNRLAEFDIPSGVLTAWRVNVVGSISSISIMDSILFVGGSFTKLGGVARNGLGAFNIKDESVMPLDLSIPLWQSVNTTAIVGNTLYIGGRFTQVGGIKRAGCAAIDLVSGQILDWNPAVNMVEDASKVNCLTATAKGIYIGGTFPQIGGVNRNNLAAISASAFKLYDWNPNANDTVYTIHLNGNTVYAGGAFTQIGGQPHNRIVSLDGITGVASSWNPDINGTVHAILVDTDTVYAGGIFSSVGGEPYTNIAAMERQSGNALAWNPNANGKVKALAKKGDRIYAGGEFTIMGGLPRKYSAALDLDGNTTSWNPYGGMQFLPSPNGNSPSAVNTIIIQDNIVYVFGNFAIRPGSFDRDAALAATTNGVLTNWRINISGGAVQAAIATETEFYVGGDFMNINSDMNRNIGVVKKSDGAPTTPFYSPFYAPNQVHAVSMGNKMLHAAGDGRIVYIPLENTLICDEDTLRFSDKSDARHIYVLNNKIWKAKAMDPWITLTPDSGAGIWGTDLAIAVADNELEQERIAVVTITGGITPKNIVVIQDARAPVGLAETAVLNKVKIYPNPCPGKLTLANHSNEKVEFLIINLNGQIVKQLSSSEGNTSTQFELEVTPGIYFVRLLSADASKILKLVVTE